MNARTTWMLVAAAMLALGSTGCVAQREVDQYQRLLREAQAQIIDLRALVEEKDAQIAALRNAGPDQATMSQLQQLQAERDRLAQALADAEAQLREAGQQQAIALPEPLDTALRELAAQYPELMSYDPELGMVKFRSDLTFPPGSAEVGGQAQQTLQRLAGILQSPVAQGYEVRVVGHTDAVPVTNPQTKARHPNNWYLSAHRAISVRDILQNAGVQPDRLGVAGYGQYRPVAPNGPNGAAEANRRVEIYLVAQPTSQFEPVNAGGSQSAPPSAPAEPQQDSPAAPDAEPEVPEMFK